jgi:hypothetical protein
MLTINAEVEKIRKKEGRKVRGREERGKGEVEIE